MRPAPAGGGTLLICGVILLVFILGTIAGRAFAQDPDSGRHRRILLLFSDYSTLPASIEIGTGVVAQFDEVLGSGYEIFTEFRDGVRFPGPKFDDEFVDAMHRKYAGVPFDAVLTIGPQILQVIAPLRDRLGWESPIIFGGVSAASVSRVSLPGQTAGIVGEYGTAGVLSLARTLQPDARRVAVFSGSSAFDRNWEETARRDFAGVDDLEFEYVSALTMEGYMEAAKQLDGDTILILLTIFEDAAGEKIIPRTAATRITAVSAAPAYSVYSAFVGAGVVGSWGETFTETGRATAKLALRVMEGDWPEAPVSVGISHPVVDWRQMQRYGLDEDRLGADAVVLNRELPAWEKYRTQILLATGIIILQSGTIIALMVQDGRRRRAERDATARRLELAHISRVTQLGELSGALAHELNQPLTSILANAEAGAQILKKEPLDLDEVASILEDIASDDRRAASIIVELRRLMSKSEANFELLDLNRVVTTTTRILQSEFLTRGVEVEPRLQRGTLTVRGSVAQLEQVLLNMMLNAADAMTGQPPEQRRMVVETRQTAGEWRELSVRDHGCGLPDELAEDPFRPFATSKPHGLGIGLSICRSIALAHGGRLAFDRTVNTGARIVLAMPPP